MTDITPNLLKHTRIVAKVYVKDYLQPHAEGGQVTALMGSLKDNGRVVRDTPTGGAGDLSLFRFSPLPRAF